MTATTIRVQMAQRKDTAAGWTAANPILLLGEIGYETDAKKFKIGDGTTNWNSLAYLPIPDGSGNLTITGNLEIGSTGTLTFEGSTADGFETTLAVTDPTADRTITLPDVTGTVVTTGDTGSVTSAMITDGTIVNADISSSAEIAVSKLANGTVNQVLVTDGTDVSWSDNLTLAGDLTVNGTTTTINTQDLMVEDKNIIIGNVDTPTDVTADGGGITLKGSTDKTINWVDSTDAWTSSERFDIPSGTDAAPSLIFNGDVNSGLYSPGADQVAISIDGSEKARIDSSARLLLGTSSAFDNIQALTTSMAPKFQVNGEGAANSSFLLRRTNGAPYFAIANGSSVSINTTIGNINFEAYDGTNHLSAARIQAVVDGTPGANNMPGRLIFSTTADGASSPTEAMRIQSNGTILVGQTAQNSGTKGIRLSEAGLIISTVDADTCLLVNRLTNDGTLLEFRQNNTTEGTISVSGTTVSYNGAHLSRWSQLVGIDPYDKTARPEILRGTVMSNLDEMCDWTCPTSGDCQDNEQLNKTEISSVDDDPNVAGVFQSWDDDDDTWVNDFYLAMTGDFVIRIAAGTTVQRGDLLCSAGDGTAKPQGDDIIRSKTIAKVTSTVVSCTHPDGSYCVPCVLTAC
jgi:hypothetical protein